MMIDHEQTCFVFMIIFSVKLDLIFFFDFCFLKRLHDWWWRFFRKQSCLW